MKILVDVLINKKKRTDERPDRELAKTFLKGSFVFKILVSSNPIAGRVRNT